MELKPVACSSAKSVASSGIEEQASTRLPTRFGVMRLKVFRNREGAESIAIISGAPEGQANVVVRVHSACLTAEVLGSLRCDCKSQLDYALQYIADHDGVIIYLPQEGRGVGLTNKIRAYALQDQGFDTVDANRKLGLPDDARSYADAARILNSLQISDIRLLTNNPLKISGLEEFGVAIGQRVPLPLMVTEHSIEYLKTKHLRMGHMLELAGLECVSPEPEAADRPLVHVNLAMDSEGKTAQQNGSALPLSCEKDWCRVHELREHYSAVVVGARTWLQDSPRLTARAERLGRQPRRQPERVIFAGRHNCEFNPDHRRTFVVGSGRSSGGSIRIEAHDHNLERPLRVLRKCGLKSLLVEGGLTLLGSFVRDGFIDRLTVYVRSDSRTVAERAVRSALPALSQDSFQFEAFGQGTLVTGDYPERPAMSAKSEPSFASG